MCIGLSPKQKKFVEKYIETKNAYKSYLYAFPTSQKWKRASVDVKASQLLNSVKVQDKIQAAELAAQKKLAKSCTLNKKKILDEIVRQYTEASASGASERQSSTQLLKLLAQIAKLTDNSTNIVVNNNNTVVNEVIGYLDL